MQFKSYIQLLFHVGLIWLKIVLLNMVYQQFDKLCDTHLRFAISMRFNRFFDEL